MALTDNLVAYWKLENTSDSVGGFTLTNNNSTTFVAGKINNCASFSRASSQSLQTSSVISSATSNVSVAMWVYINSASEYGCFFHNGDPVVDSGDDGWGVGVGGTTFDNPGGPGNNLLILRNGVAWQSAVGTLGTGWVHVAVVLDGTTWRGYINGVAGSTSSGAPSTPTAGTIIGSNNIDGAAPAFFNDKIDEVGFWSRVLSPTEVTELYNSGSGITYPFSSETRVTPTAISFTGNQNAYVIKAGAMIQAAVVSSLGNIISPTVTAKARAVVGVLSTLMSIITPRVRTGGLYENAQKFVSTMTNGISKASSVWSNKSKQ